MSKSLFVIAATGEGIMEVEVLPAECQIHYLQRVSDPLKLEEILFQLLTKRLKRVLKRRFRYVVNWCTVNNSANSPGYPSSHIAATSQSLNSGDLVSVKSKQEIRATLDHWNCLQGCTFLEEMWVYCGTTQRVFKRVEKFLDERDYMIKKCNGIVLLDNVICQGTRDFGPCDRSCFYFWRQEWLEKVATR